MPLAAIGTRALSPTKTRMLAGFQGRQAADQSANKGVQQRREAARRCGLAVADADDADFLTFSAKGLVMAVNRRDFAALAAMTFTY
jgi:hypothetical protein